MGLLLAAAIAVALLFSRASVLLFLVVGVLLLPVLWLVGRLARRTAHLLRERRPVVVAIAIALPVLTICSVIAVAYFTGGGGGEAYYASEVSLPYSATVVMNDGRMIVQEQITADRQFMAAAYESEFSSASGSGAPGRMRVIVGERPANEPGVWIALPEGWSQGPLVDGNQTFDRSTAFPAHLPALGMATLEVPIDLGEAEISQNDSHRFILTLAPRDGSVAIIDAKKGAIAATYPATISTTDLLQAHLAETRVGILSGEPIRFTMLPPILQNQAGIIVYQAVAWGPLPWVIGLFGLGVMAALGKRLGDLLDGVMKKLFP